MIQMVQLVQILVLGLTKKASGFQQFLDFGLLSTKIDFWFEGPTRSPSLLSAPRVRSSNPPLVIFAGFILFLYNNLLKNNK